MGAVRIYGTVPMIALAKNEESETADWQNGFSRVGVGFGGTRLNGWIRARIDHILTSHDWIPVRAWIGEDVGSDHAAVITRIRLRSVE